MSRRLLLLHVAFLIASLGSVSSFAQSTGDTVPSTADGSANDLTDLAHRALPVMGSLGVSRKEWAELKEASEATLAVRLDIDERGKLLSCTIDESSGSPTLDKRICKNLFGRNAQFIPGTDAEGRPIRKATVRRLRFVCIGQNFGKEC